MKTLAQCLQTLIRTASGDGNLLFNVGPMPSGEIEPRQVERLKQMGQWLARYGASIYATRGGPFMAAKHVVSTRHGNTIYLHILAWPEEELRLPSLPAKIVDSRMLTGGRATVRQTVAGIEVAVPKPDRQEIDTIIALELDRSALDIPPIAVAAVSSSLTEGKPAKASNVWQNDSAYAAVNAVDGQDETRWATDPDIKQSWLEVDLGKPETFDHAMIDECLYSGVRVSAFALQCQEGKGWKTFFKGANMGKKREVRFPPVTAQHVRLSIEGDRGPSINEFQLFAPSR
jgi:alpha-L-fucosidase